MFDTFQILHQSTSQNIQKQFLGFLQPFKQNGNSRHDFPYRDINHYLVQNQKRKIAVGLP